MRFHRFFPLASSLILALSALPGCAAPEGADDDALATEDESELRSCELGASCGAVKLLAAVTVPGGNVGRARRDLTFRFAEGTSAGHSTTPRAFRQTTTPTLRRKAGVAVYLAGDTSGQADVVVDDNLLVEVLDAGGAVIASALLGNGNHTLSRGEAPIAHQGPSTWTGEGYAVGARAVDLAPLLPASGAFRLRVSALDHGGAARVSDVYLVTAEAAPPPAREVLLDDAVVDAAHPPTQAEAAALFGPGETWRELGVFALGERRRACNDATGCGPWRASDTTSLHGTWYDKYFYPHGALVTTPMGRVPVRWTGRAGLSVVGSDIVFRPILTGSSRDSSDCGLGGACPLVFTSDPDCDPFGDGALFCNTKPRTLATAKKEALAFAVRFGAGYYVGRTPSYREPRTGEAGWEEVVFQLYGRLEKGTTTKLEVSGDRLLARW